MIQKIEEKLKELQDKDELGSGVQEMTYVPISNAVAGIALYKKNEKETDIVVSVSDGKEAEIGDLSASNLFFMLKKYRPLGKFDFNSALRDTLTFAAFLFVVFFMGRTILVHLGQRDESAIPDGDNESTRSGDSDGDEENLGEDEQIRELQMQLQEDIKKRQEMRRQELSTADDDTFLGALGEILKDPITRERLKKPHVLPEGNTLSLTTIKKLKNTNPYTRQPLTYYPNNFAEEVKKLYEKYVEASAAGTSAAGTSAAGTSAAETSAAETSAAETSAAGTSAAGETAAGNL